MSDSDYSLSPWGRPRTVENSTPNYNNGPMSTNKSSSLAYEYSPSVATSSNYQLHSQNPSFVYSKVSHGNFVDTPQVGTLSRSSNAYDSPQTNSVYGSASSAPQYKMSLGSSRSNFLNQAPQTAVEYNISGNMSGSISVNSKAQPVTTNSTQNFFQQNKQQSAGNINAKNKYNGLSSINSKKAYISMEIGNNVVKNQDGSQLTTLKIQEKKQGGSMTPISPKMNYNSQYSSSPPSLSPSLSSSSSSATPVNSYSKTQNTPQMNALRTIENSSYFTPQPSSPRKSNISSPMASSSTTTTLMSSNSPVKTQSTMQINTLKLPEKSQNDGQDSRSSSISPRINPDPASASNSAQSAPQTNEIKSPELNPKEQKNSESRKWRRKHDAADGGSGDQIVLTSDGSSLGPWKLQPQQPLPKKAEAGLIKARMYLEQVKKKPSDELIQNRMDKIKLLNNSVPDWVPDQESPVCTFCGKIFNVLARRVNKYIYIEYY